MIIDTMGNQPQPGDRIYYYGDHDQVVNGIVAERQLGPLTGDPNYRVVDFASEMKDPEAGRWIPIGRVTGIFPTKGD